METRLLYDRKTAAKMLSLSIRSLAYLLSRGEIRFRRLGAKILIPHSELVRFANGHHPEPMNGAPRLVCPLRIIG
jgi:excisionase family DNA binding protein